MSENSDGENGLPRGPVPVELSVSYCVGTSKAYDENVRESTSHCCNDRIENGNAIRSRYNGRLRLGQKFGKLMEAIGENILISIGTKILFEHRH